ncbi:hypothetical protein EW026_g5995 [Hermanssonia centrifuga]|uniref:Uncharacterized protein n=1 Tax=Hermanssonia centrifuga TaxID=98765 RepID=A0A4S4KCG3_9APHY|nr:hypothetical protein EW026_g5995 [Hermanssonia centrifuga]
MSTYTLTVNVNSDDVLRLKQAGYKLCIAKRVNGKYDVVWSGADFLVKNTFKWDSEFQVFGSQTFEGGLQVSADTEEQDIKFGETCTLDQYGRMRPAHGSADPKSGVLHVENNYRLMHIGVNAKLGKSWSPIYLSEQPFYTGKVDLTPVEKVMIWFDSKSATGTMLVDAITDCLELDFTGNTAPQTVLYASDPNTPGKGGWQRAEQIVLSSTYHINTDTFSFEPPSVSLLAKLTDIINSQKDVQLSKVSVSALVEFHEPGAAQTFAQFALEHQPDGVRTWEFTHSGHIVESKLKAQKDQEDDLAVRFLQDAYLGVLYSFQDSKYKRLSFDIHGRTSLPTPNVVPDPRSSGELRVIYSTRSQAAEAARGINALTGNGLSYAAAVHSDDKEWVRVLLSLTFPSGNVDQDRRSIVDPLATALFGGGEYFSLPPLFPNLPNYVIDAVQWNAN